MVLVGCGKNPIDQIHTQVKDRLKDPDSAVFKEDKKIFDRLYCGQVNAKNAMGGFVGYKPYVAVALENKSDEVSWTIGLGEDDALVDTFCIQGVARAKGLLRQTNPSGKWLVSVKSESANSYDVEKKLESLGYQTWMVKEGESLVGPYDSQHAANMVDTLIGLETGYQHRISQQEAARKW